MSSSRMAATAAEQNEKMDDITAASIAAATPTFKINHISDQGMKASYVFDGSSPEQPYIHIDDSIGAMKLKLFQVMGRTTSVDEMYLFCFVQRQINPVQLYQSFTMNDTQPFTRDDFHVILNNLTEPATFYPYRITHDQLAETANPIFDDILKLNLRDASAYYLAQPVGQYLATHGASSQILFTANPFFALLSKSVDDEMAALGTTVSPNFYDEHRQKVSMSNNSLILDIGPIVDNTFYLCTADDVLRLAESKEIFGANVASSSSGNRTINVKSLCSLYFPMLHDEDNIDSYDALVEKKQMLLEKSVKMLTNSTQQSFDNIDMMYSIFKQQLPTNAFILDDAKTGITGFKIAYHSPYRIRIPVDVIFRLLHTSRGVPLIKFNPHLRQENIYRLYADKTTSDGRKIPYLSRPMIFKLIRGIGKSRSVAIYTHLEYQEQKYNIICEFYENGDIIVYPFSGKLSQPIYLATALSSSLSDQEQNNPFQHMDAIIRNAVNPLIDAIAPFFEQSGLKLELYQTIYSPNVELLDMEYTTVYQITKHVRIRSFSCVSSVFVIEGETNVGALKLRFKRVSNYNLTDSQEAFALDKFYQGYSRADISRGLMENFPDMQQQEVNDIIIKITSDLAALEGTSESKRHRTMSRLNPGFPVTMTVNTSSSDLTIVATGLNSIYYLNTLPIYLNSIVRLTQDITSTEYPEEDIVDKCQKRVDDNANLAFNDGGIRDIAIAKLGADEDGNGVEIQIPANMAAEARLRDDETEFNDTDNMLLYGQQQITRMDDVLNILGLADFDDEEEEEEEEEEDMGGGGEGENVSTSIYPDTQLTMTEKEKQCEAVGKDYNPKTGRCVNKCGPGEIRDENFRCKKITVGQYQSKMLLEMEEAELAAAAASSNGTPVSIRSRSPGSANMVSHILNVDGKRLKYPTPFSEKINKLMPQLFLKSKNEKIDAYTRMCPSAEKRQPVILTEREKNDILANDRSGIDPESDLIEYSADGKNNYYFMCPRFWCLLTNTVVTEKDILQGKCGPKVDKVEDAVIPDDADVVPKGRYVYEFYGKDTKKYPGFHKKNTPGGLCVPCCYTKWNTKTMQKRRDVCQAPPEDKTKQKQKNRRTGMAQIVSSSDEEEGDNDDASDNAKKTKASKKAAKESKVQFYDSDDDEDEMEKQTREQLRKAIETQEIDTYIKGPEKYPLENRRWGYLPSSIQMFLQEINLSCQVSKQNTSLRSNHTCLLRCGVERSSKQSFIACLASALFFVATNPVTKQPLIHSYMENATAEVPSIRDMKEIILRAINLDSFLTYQNGNLLTEFANPSHKISLLEEYVQSNLYKKIIAKGVDPTKHSPEMDFFVKAIQAYETFQAYMRDATAYIDYTYLWDIVSEPNPKLFPSGLNLIIFEIPEEDMTNNIELLCPTNHYSAKPYDPARRSLLIVKRHAFFEPMYTYRVEERAGEAKRTIVTKTFHEKDTTLSTTMRNIFHKIIRPTLEAKCVAMPSKPREYKFTQSPLLSNLLHTLAQRKYEVKEQVLNFQGKVIALAVESPTEKRGMIPCYPSSMNPKKEYVFMTDESKWQNYDDTFDFLDEWYRRSSSSSSTKEKDVSKHTCTKSFCQVVDHSLVIGFLTNTNQFIPINPPLAVSHAKPVEEIETITNNNYLVADTTAEVSKPGDLDKERIDFILRIQLETTLFNIFRNTIRIMFNDYVNAATRKKIMAECGPYSPNNYNERLSTVVELLREMTDDYIIFVEDYKYKKYADHVSSLGTCISQSGDKCAAAASSTNTCMVTQDKCALVLPKENLVTETDNEEYYFTRMADELIRYNRVKSFMFRPQTYLSFGTVAYNLHANEIIILQDMITQEYFESLVPAEKNTYAQYNTYDTAQPIQTQPYNKQVDFDDYQKLKHHATPVATIVTGNNGKQKVNVKTKRVVAVVEDASEEEDNEPVYYGGDDSSSDSGSDTSEENNESKIDCIAEHAVPIRFQNWANCFSSDDKYREYRKHREYREDVYANTSTSCTFYLLKRILAGYRSLRAEQVSSTDLEIPANDELTVSNLRNTLMSIYSKKTQAFTNKTEMDEICDIWEDQGKSTQELNGIRNGSVHFRDYIIQDLNMLCSFDVELVLNHYGIPFLFLIDGKNEYDWGNKGVNRQKMFVSRGLTSLSNVENKKVVIVTIPANCSASGFGLVVMVKNKIHGEDSGDNSDNEWMKINELPECVKEKITTVMKWL